MSSSEVQEKIEAKREAGYGYKPESTDQIGRITVVYVDVGNILPNIYNPNRQGEHEFELLCRSILEDGFTQPVILNENPEFLNMIVDGEHRWRAAQVVGLDRIPAVYGHFTDAQMKVSTLRHNMARGEHDIELEGAVVTDLIALGAADWLKTGLLMSDVEIQRLSEDVPKPQDFGIVIPVDGTQAEIVDAINQYRTAETNHRVELRDQDRDQLAKEHSIYRIALLFSDEEAEIVRECLGKDKVNGVVALCLKYGVAPEDEVSESD